MCSARNLALSASFSWASPQPVRPTAPGAERKCSADAPGRPVGKSGIDIVAVELGGSILENAGLYLQSVSGACESVTSRSAASARSLGLAQDAERSGSTGGRDLTARLGIPRVATETACCQRDLS